MKKVIGQTVRDLKREVNKKVLKVPSIEQKVLDATSNEPWGPHGSLLADIAQATKNYHEYQMIMNVIWKRINDTGKNWRHVYKALIVLEYLTAHGSERVIDEIREHAYQISTLSDFHYVDSSGRDQGNNVRRKSQSLAALVNDKERVQEIRQKGAANRDKSRGSFSTGRSGGYGDHFEDDRYENRHASRDDDRYPRGGDPYGRERDRNGGYSDECYGKDGHRDDDVRGGRGNDDYQHGSRNRSLRRNRSFDDDDRYSSRSGGSRADDFPREERPLERKLSEQSIGAPPSYEEATRDAQNHVQENSPTSRNGDESVAAAPKASSPSAPKITSPSESTIQGSLPFAPADSSPSRSTNQGLDHAPVGVSAQTNNNNDNSFDEFDPRSSISVTPPAANGLEMDIFGSASDPIYSLSLTPFSTTTNSTDVDLPVNSGHGTDFMVMPSSSAVFSQPGENPFGDPPFIAIQENPLNQQEVFAPVNSFNSIFTGGANVHPPAAPKIETVTGFDFDSFGVTYNPVLEGQQSSFSSPASLTPEVPLTQPSNEFSTRFAPQPEHAAFVPIQEAQAATPAYGQGNLLPQSGQPAPFALQATQFTTQDAHHIAQINYQTTQLNHLSQPGLQAPVSMEPQPPAPIHVQGNLLPSPFASQTTQFTAQDDHPITQTNNQTTQLNFLSQPGLQAPVSMEVQPAAPAHGQGNLPQSGQPAPFALQATQFTTQDACPITQINNHTNQSNLLSQPGPQIPISMEVTAPAAALPPIKSAPLKEKFEPKSTVWADTLSRGLVNLNISGPKINPHADIGIDFDSMNRKERREEKKVAAAPVSTTTMGKAMGSGTGIGRAGASSLSAPPNLMGSGLGMGMGMGMGMGLMGGGDMGMGMMGGGGMGTGMMGGAGMGMGSYGGNMNRPMGMGMNQGTPMGMGMNQGMPPQPPMGVPPGGGGMPGASYNPMMGMGNYGSQQPYGGGYR